MNSFKISQTLHFFTITPVPSEEHSQGKIHLHWTRNNCIGLHNWNQYKLVKGWSQVLVVQRKQTYTLLCYKKLGGHVQQCAKQYAWNQLWACEPVPMKRMMHYRGWDAWQERSKLWRCAEKILKMITDPEQMANLVCTAKPPSRVEKWRRCVKAFHPTTSQIDTEIMSLNSKQRW